MKTAYFTVLSAAIIALIFSCSKPEIEAPGAAEQLTTSLADGIPSGADSINGYLYASQWFSVLPGFNTHTLTLYAAFRDPEGNLSRGIDHRLDNIYGFGPDLPNVELKSLVYEATTLNRNNNGASSVYYFTKTNVPKDVLTEAASWKSGGNLTFLPFDIDLTGRYPLPAETGSVYPVSRQTGVKFDMNAFFSNYDSASVRIPYGPLYNTPKTVSKKSPDIYFAREEVGSVLYDTIEIFFSAYKYSHITISGKKYLFELSRKYRKRIAMTP